MARPKGSKAKHTRDNRLSLVRLTDAERRQVETNASHANLSIAGFVRARILPEVDGTERLTDPIPGGRQTAKRSALTDALQRIAVNLAQLESFVADLGNLDLEEDFGALRLTVKRVQTAHLASTSRGVQQRSGWTDELDELGRQLNRMARGAHSRGSVARPLALSELVGAIAGAIEAMEAGEKGAES